MNHLENVTIHCGDVRKELRKLPAQSVHCVVTSPPYWQLRDYGFEGQIGLEKSPKDFIRELVKVFRQVRRVLRDDGTLWVNMGDSHIHSTVQQSSYRRDRADAMPKGVPKGFKIKDKALMPHRLAIALQDDGWYVRQDIVWHKQQPQPETVSDRPTTAHEFLFLLSKRQRYYYDATSIAEPCSDKTHARSASAKALRSSAVRDLGSGRAKYRMTPPSGWATGMPERDSVQLSRRTIRPKQNASFAEFMGDLVPTRNKRSVWPCYTDRMDLKTCAGCGSVYTSTTFADLAEVDGIIVCPTCHAQGSPIQDRWDSHFAAFGAEWIEPCILAGCPPGGMVLDPFSGTGTTAGVAVAHGRHAVLIEGKREYINLIPHRVEQVVRRLRNAPPPPMMDVAQISMFEDF